MRVHGRPQERGNGSARSFGGGMVSEGLSRRTCGSRPGREASAPSRRGCGAARTGRQRARV